MTITPTVPAVWLKPCEAASYCSVHTETIRRAFRVGALQGVRIGSGLRFKREHLDAWLAAGGRSSEITSIRSDDNCGQRRTPEDGR